MNTPTVIITIEKVVSQLFISHKAEILAVLFMLLALPATAQEQVCDSAEITSYVDVVGVTEYFSTMRDSLPATLSANLNIKPKCRANIYELPYSVTGRCYDWHRLWINTAVLSGAFVGTLVVLECLPENTTSWNRAELQDVPLFKRWYNHVIYKGPEWDHDLFIFNYVLHPYAGAVYYMAARSCGFNAWQSLLYCSIISNIGWEFGIEAFMERPSVQDLFVTPLIGAAIGEGFYHLKRHIVRHDYTLAGSKILGNIVVFLIDPVNEVVGLFAGNPCRGLYKKDGSGLQASTIILPGSRDINYGFSLRYTF